MKAEALRPLAVLLGGMLLAQAQAGTGASVGHVVFVRGGVASLAGGEASATTLLDSGAEVFEGDVLETGNDSFVVLEFADKARVTVRPNSRFRVEKYATGGDGAAKLFLEKGGVRMAPGDIAKAQPDKFQLQTPSGGVVSPKGSAYSARLCEQDCTVAQAAPAAAPVDDEKAAAHVVQQDGIVSALDGKGGERALSPGAAVFEGERIRSLEDSSAVLLFRDQGKVTIQPSSSFEISEYRYQAQDAGNGRSVIRLLAGGIRALTGVIGKTRQENVKFVTPVATVGIRGTGLDGYCQGSCTADDPAAATAQQRSGLGVALGAVPAGGFYSNTWQGAVEICNDAGCVMQPEGRSTYTASHDRLAQFIVNMPETMRQGPRPDTVKRSDGDKPLAGAAALAGKGGGPRGGGGAGGPGGGQQGKAPPGLYVAADDKDGVVSVEGKDGSRVTAGAGQSAFVSGSGQAGVTEETKTPLADESAPRPTLGLNQLQQNFSPLTDRLPAGGAGGGFMCTSQ